ncbi:MAG: 2-oxoacid:ferredoxin oxidoreductase subunit beta [Deltaproteobacteria bacterium]|nr:2-oxoacid:ferredoxin oxidoreductase subunit beta [Deltaproteobacteria bacterium]
MDYFPYLRKEKLPHIWCSGCGDGIALKCIIRAIHNKGLDKNKIAMVSGIGCSSRTPGYVDFNTLHTTHGRAIPFATGLKMARPELTVFVVTGDGDATAIGGNHLIHAARRNIDLKVLLYNNHIYGMTGGQVSPCTPMGDYATTAPYGCLENSFDIAGLTVAAGASFVARSTVYHVKALEKLIEKAIDKEGFSLIEIMSPCPTSYGKINKKGANKNLVLAQKTQSVPVNKAKDMSPEDLKGKIVTGILADRDIPEYIKNYDMLTSQKK